MNEYTHASMLIMFIGFISTGCSWNIEGNAGLNSDEHFLGTTDSQPLVIKTNNVQAMRIETNGNVGVGVSTAEERLSVAGIIESTSGGVKFPDGTIQTTAAAVSSLSTTIRESSITIPATTCCRTAGVSCLAGEVATGGGFTRADDPSLEVFRNQPVANGWRVSVTNYGSASRTIGVYAVCLALQ